MQSYSKAWIANSASAVVRMIYGGSFKVLIKSKPLKSERCKEPWKVLDSSKFDCERQEDKSNASASYYEENSIIDGPGEKLPTERADHLREENLDDLMNDIVDLDKEMNLMMKQI